MIKVELDVGDTVEVVLKDTDGKFTISYGGIEADVLNVMSELPGNKLGGEGEIYREEFGLSPDEKLVAKTVVAKADEL